MSEVITEPEKMMNVDTATKKDGETNLVTKENTTDMKSVRKRKSTTAVEVDAITGSQTKTVKNTKQRGIIAKETSRGTTKAGSVKSTSIQMRGVRDIKMMDPILHFLLLCSLCLTLVRNRRVTELELT